MTDVSAKFYEVCLEPTKAIRIVKKHRELAEDHECFLHAAECCSNKVLREFIKHGVDVNLLDEYDKTPISYAIRGFKIDNTLLLLEAGADPFVEDAIKFLVLDGIHKKPPTRLKILKALIDAGVDINRELKPIEGNGYSYKYNLLACATNCEDIEVVKILNKNGGELFEVESDLAEVPPLNLETLQKRLVRGLKKGWSEVKRERKHESFYVFGLVTDSDCQTVIPVCNTLELVEQEMGEMLNEYPSQKYHLPSVEKLYGAGEEQFQELSREVSHRDFGLRVKSKLLKIFEDALAELDEKKFFGTGKNRNKILLMIAFSDPDEREEKLEERIIRRLNPKEAHKAYFAK